MLIDVSNEKAAGECGRNTEKRSERGVDSHVKYGSTESFEM
jgi:hypothetical protein